MSSNAAKSNFSQPSSSSSGSLLQFSMYSVFWIGGDFLDCMEEVLGAFPKFIRGLNDVGVLILNEFLKNLN